MHCQPCKLLETKKKLNSKKKITSGKKKVNRNSRYKDNLNPSLKKFSYLVNFTYLQATRLMSSNTN